MCPLPVYIKQMRVWNKFEQMQIVAFGKISLISYSLSYSIYQNLCSLKKHYI